MFLNSSSNKNNPNSIKGIMAKDILIIKLYMFIILFDSASSKKKSPAEISPYRAYFTFCLSTYFGW
jgi:hypothetical protein